MSILVLLRHVLVAFDEIVKPLKARAAPNMNVATNLASVGDTLLHKLISGQLRLNDKKILSKGNLQ